jgi:hypothetical protein
LLAGVPAQEMERARDLLVAWPDVTGLVGGQGLGTSMQVAGDHLADSPAVPVALLVLGRFARGLRGFAGSSAAYLAEQFINLPGHLLVDGEKIEVYLSRAPLGTVLQMAGQDGDRGPIPWLNGRHLWIHLP